jgi:hypothetical protein
LVIKNCPHLIELAQAANSATHSGIYGEGTAVNTDTYARALKANTDISFRQGDIGQNLKMIWRVIKACGKRPKRSTTYANAHKAPLILL